MKDNLVRFGVAMESSLVEQLDELATARGCNRSELIRDLTRAEMSRTVLEDAVPAFAAVTLVYNHHVRELSERLTALQHDLGDQVRSTMHVHLDHEHCLEVIVMRGRSDDLKSITGRMIGTRGVLHGGAEYVSENMLSLGGHGPAHPHGHEHHHLHDHGEADRPHPPPQPSPKSKRAGKPARGAPRSRPKSR
jgi:CopG family nickel-responsive transcriptional regulator